MYNFWYFHQHVRMWLPDFLVGHMLKTWNTLVEFVLESEANLRVIYGLEEIQVNRSDQFL